MYTDWCLQVISRLQVSLHYTNIRTYTHTGSNIHSRTHTHAHELQSDFCRLKVSDLIWRLTCKSTHFFFTSLPIAPVGFVFLAVVKWLLARGGAGRILDGTYLGSCYPLVLSDGLAVKDKSIWEHVTIFRPLSVSWKNCGPRTEPELSTPSTMTTQPLPPLKYIITTLENSYDLRISHVLRFPVLSDERIKSSASKCSTRK